MTAIPLNDFALALPSAREVVITRTFDAPRALVYEALSKPEHVKRWWGLRASTMTTCEMDVRVGGSYRFVIRDPSGAEYAFVGEYRELDPPAKVVSTFAMEGMPFNPAVETMTLEEVGGKTKLTSVLAYVTPEERDGHLGSGMEVGARESYDRLAELLVELKPQER